MELLRTRGSDERLRELWGDLDYTFPIMDVLSVDGEAFVLRYAAIQWRRPRAGASRIRNPARWLVELADVYKLLVEDVPKDIDAFCAPIVHIDLDEHLRVAFTSATPEIVPPEVAAGQAWDERALVFLVGQLFERLVEDVAGSPFKNIYATCIHAKPAKRWPSLNHLIGAVAGLGMSAEELRARPDLDAWRAVEEGIGWLHLGYLDRAAWKFDHALSSLRYAPLARWGLERAGAPPAASHRPWPVAELPREPVRTSAESLALARQALHAADTGYAGMLAIQVLSTEPENAEAMVIIAQAHLRNRHYERALKQIEKMPNGSSAQYLRGKALLGMGRHHDARDAFDRALALDPKLLEAMLLRREADRQIRIHQRDVGEQKAIDLEIPESLAELRDILLSGDIAQAISALEVPRYREEPEAQLRLGHLLTFIDSHASAIAAFDRAITQPDLRFDALLGKARSLDALGKNDSALAIFDELTAERPNNADVSEGRARALEKLGRLGEAAAEFRRFISFARGGSDLRVRAAEDWLRAHPL